MDAGKEIRGRDDNALGFKLSQLTSYLTRQSRPFNLERILTKSQWINCVYAVCQIISSTITFLSSLTAEDDADHR